MATDELPASDVTRPAWTAELAGLAARSPGLYSFLATRATRPSTPVSIYPSRSALP